MNVLLSVDWTFTMAVVLTGIAVVFTALVLLVFVIWLFGKIAEAVKKAASPKAEKAPAPAPAPKPQVVQVAAPGLSDEVVAAITGAISAVLAEEGEGKSYVVKSVKRIRKSRPAWGRAGALDSTRPF